ncbi:MAG: MMPL family transporter, partial [Porticoccaceae bacterium]
MADRITAFFQGMLARPWLIILLTLVYLAVTVSGLDGLVRRSDYKSLLDPEYPGMVELDEVEAIFNENKNALLVVVPRDGDLFSPQTLVAIQELTERSWLIPYAARVDSLTNFQHTEVEEDDLAVMDLVPHGRADDSAVIQRARRVASEEPALRGFLVSERQDVAAVNITFQFREGTLLSQEQEEISAAIRELVADFEANHPHIDMKVTGSVVLDYSADEYTARVNSIQMPIMLALMGVLLVMTLRSLWASLATAVIVILTGVTTMGFFGWFGMEIDGVTAIAPIVIMTLAVAGCVHVIGGIAHGMQQGQEKRAAILYGLRLNLFPVFLTTVTTVLGVITFTFTDFPSLRKLGVIIAFGDTVAFVLVVTLLPVLLLLMPYDAGKRRIARFSFDALGDWVIRHHKKILPVSVVLCIAASAMIPRIVINESFENLFDESTEQQRAIAFVSENLSGFLAMDVAVFGAEPGALNDPDFLDTLDAFQAWVKDWPGVNHVNTITDTFKRLNQNMHGDDPDWYRLPDDQELAAQYLLLYEMSLPYGLDLNNKVNLDKSATRLTLTMSGMNSGETVALKQAIIHWFEREAPHLKVVPTGMIPLMAEAGYLHMIPNMMKGGIVAVLMVSLVLFFSLRSWRLGLLGMFANIVPIMMGYGLWGATHGMANFAVMSVAGICLGVVVDFAVHFLIKYRQGSSRSGSVEEGIRYAFNRVASPLWITMVVLVAGFWVLATAQFNLVSELGLLTGIIIFLALVVNLLMLPAILLTFNKTFQVPVAAAPASAA